MENEEKPDFELALDDTWLEAEVKNDKRLTVVAPPAEIDPLGAPGKCLDSVFLIN